MDLNLSTWTVAFLFAALFIGFNWLRAIFIRPFLRMFLRGQEDTNNIVGYVLGLYSVMYGLLVGMLAIVTYQTLSEAQATAEKEATSLAALYRDAQSYPEPTSKILTTLLRDYTQYVINEAWPLQRKGVVPIGGTQHIEGIRSQIVQFEPKTKGQEILHAEALRQFNEFISIRTARLNSVNDGGLPPILWYTGHRRCGDLHDLHVDVRHKSDDAADARWAGVICDGVDGLSHSSYG